MMFKVTLAFFIIACFVAAEAARLPRPMHYRDPVERLYKYYLQRRACVALGATGCAANNGKCCRQGNPYTGTMRKCVNTGSSSSPQYTCVEA